MIIQNCIFLFISDLVAQMTTNNTVTMYASKGKSAVLKCQVDPNNVPLGTWLKHSRTDDMTIYTRRYSINPSLSNKVKIVGNITNGEYNLQINNVSATDEGIYLCIPVFNLSTSYVKLIIQGKYKLEDTTRRRFNRSIRK